ncbi:unnamed protein product [Allacma fusca]|uniref:Uncharacterized protein n=1 Tax=Allacma fusca TaxID=39272 RepID=A0A8J2LQT6_9HEXA|nr:unnamed protein product [Allacma fusca]
MRKDGNSTILGDLVKICFTYSRTFGQFLKDDPECKIHSITVSPFIKTRITLHPPVWFITTTHYMYSRT